jgi:hypothetical protein
MGVAGPRLIDLAEGSQHLRPGYSEARPGGQELPLNRGLRMDSVYLNRTDDLRITSVSRALLAGSKPSVSFRFTGCCWWRSLVVDGGSGASRDTPVMP